METQKSAKLGTMPTGRLLLSMSLPMMVSFFIQALYNIVDSMFVARLSENALTAVTLAFPVQQIMTAISVGIGVGCNALIPRALGEKKQDRADRIAQGGMTLALVCAVFFCLSGFFLPRPFYGMQTDVSEIVDGGHIYLTICMTVSLGVFFGQVFEKILVASGRPLLAMASQATGAVFNIVFDPLLIFGLGPFPRMEIAGAALATVLGQILGAGVALAFCLKEKIVKLQIGRDGKAMRNILGVGVPSMITIGLSSAMSFSVNQILLSYSTTATAVFGIWMKLQNFCFMPIFGMNNGMVPILSYNAGIGRYDRVHDTERKALLVALVLELAVVAVLEAKPGMILRLFNASDDMMAIGVTALRYTVASLPFGALCVILGTSMQALSHSRYTLILNILRQFVLLVLAFASISALTHDLSKVWIAVPGTEVVSLCVASCLFGRMRRDEEKEERERGLKS